MENLNAFHQQPIDNKYVFNSRSDIDNQLEVEIRPIDSLRWVNTSGPDEEPNYRYTSDTELLLNEKRIINELGRDNWNKIVSSLNAPSQKYKQGSYSDDELLSTVKSKYCQSPSEIKEWLDSWIDNAEDFTQALSEHKQELLKKQAEEYQKHLDDIKKQLGTPQVEPAPGGDNQIV